MLELFKLALRPSVHMLHGGSANPRIALASSLCVHSRSARCVCSLLVNSGTPAAPALMLPFYVCISLSPSAVPSGLFRWLYERFRLPAAPVYGGFPVKFRTFLGDPIPYDPNVGAAELAQRVRACCGLGYG